MKKLLFLSCLSALSFLKSQTQTWDKVECVMDDKMEAPVNKSVTPSTNCGNNSPYFSNSNLYTPSASDEIIYIKLNFIFLTKPDGTGNFEQNNPEHNQVIDDIVARMNYRLGNMGQPVVGCDGYGANNFTDTRIRVIVNKIWKADPAWDFLYTGYNPSQGPLGGTAPLYPPSDNYYYNYYDNDPTIPQGINCIFSNNGQIYNELMSGNYSVPLIDGWAASEFPYYYTLNRKLRQFWPNLFNKYIQMKNFVVGNPTWGSPTWPTVREWYTGMGYNSFPHELGHNLSLSHSDCGSNIMSYDAGNHDYFSIQNISDMYRSASVSSVRQYFTQDSFKNADINITNSQTWDVNMRTYSNVDIDNNSSLLATCNLIMAPESRIIVRDGSNFVMTGADVSAVNHAAWNGIKVEGNGYLLITQDTKIDYENFYAYADNTVLPKAMKTNNINQLAKQDKLTEEIKTSTKDVKIYPNPSSTVINIDLKKEEINNWMVYDMSGKVMLKGNDTKVLVENLPKTNYLLIINLTNGNKVSKKILVK
ncbi:T9SS type A sorting domain-containing protein [Chryseobacterium sp. SIMBA_038]|uniref:T9SS type A sorting domain-containing protein n=1 Tax=Chryseobacterium sp. SIMBA_038 TaxID=3085780 RepID=UPI0039788AE6